MEELRECPFCGEYLVRTQNSYTNKHGEKCKEDYYSHDVLKNPGYCLAEEICVGNNLKDITAWNTRPDSWISVEERLPDTTTVLGCNIEGFVTTVLYMSNAKRWVITSNMSVIMDVTHWMPLPEPPKGDEN